MLSSKFRPKFPVTKVADETKPKSDLREVATAIAEMCLFIMGATICWGILFSLVIHFSK